MVLSGLDRTFFCSKGGCCGLKMTTKGTVWKCCLELLCENNSLDFFIDSQLESDKDMELKI